VTGLAAAGTSAHETTLTWEAAAGADTYVVRRDGQEVHSGSGLSLTDTGLTPQTTYTYTVAAVNAGGEGPSSDPVTVVTPMEPPAAVGDVTATRTADAVTLTWNAAARAENYTVRRDGADIHTGTDTVFEDTDVEPDTEYTYRVRASNTGGDGPASDPVVVRTLPLPPLAPTGLQVTGVTRTTVDLQWDATDGATGYVIERDGMQVGSPSGTTFTDSGLTAGTEYTYRVQAVGPGGTGDASTPVTATTDASPVTVYRLSGDVWKLNDSGANLGTAWREVGYDDAAWKSGPTEFGYGEGDEATVLSWGTNATAKPITVYGRSTFDAGSVSDVTGLRLRLLVDDGAVVYLNGTEIHRFNLPTGTITSTTRASRYIAGAEERQWRTIDLPASALRPGANTLAVEVHQDAPSSSDLSLNLELHPIR
jgi:chitodextrinase